MPLQRGAAIVIISDSVAAGERTDGSGPILENLLAESGFSVRQKFVVADEQAQIVDTFQGLIAMNDVRLIVSSGGTGLGPRDVTPEAALTVLTKLIPGMAEAMRATSLAKTPFAMTSRQVVGAVGDTLLVTLPGSPKAVQECYEVIAPVLFHVLDLLANHTTHPETRLD